MKIVIWCGLIIIGGVLVLISLLNPALIAENKFLHDFINHEILNVQSVVVTVTLVSITHTHLEFSKLEKVHQLKVFGSARREINGTAVYLILSFLIMLFLLMFVGGTEPKEQPITNSLLKSSNILLLVASIAAMADVLKISYELSNDPSIEEDESEES